MTYVIGERQMTGPTYLISFLSPLFAGGNKMSSLDIRLEGKEKEGYAIRSELQPTLEQNE
jgi:hypothetical protein